jgi:hypothetical protein
MVISYSDNAFALCALKFFARDVRAAAAGRHGTAEELPAAVATGAGACGVASSSTTVCLVRLPPIVEKYFTQARIACCGPESLAGKEHLAQLFVLSPESFLGSFSFTSSVRRFQKRRKTDRVM